ncbi:Synaptopodin [Manis pentadactyla]|nr:Synaptopodin [Manis pentadactyla]
MLGPHLPPPPLGCSEDRPTPCTFQIPDGSYRCLALEAEESGGEESLTDLEEEGAVSRQGHNSTCGATQEAPELPRALGIQPLSHSKEARVGPQHENGASQDWDMVKARQVTTAICSPTAGPRGAQKPAISDVLADISAAIPSTLFSKIIRGSDHPP